MKPKDNFFLTLRNYLTVYLPMQKCCSEKTLKSYREVLNYLMDYLRDVKGISLRQISFDLFDELLVLDFWTGCKQPATTARLHGITG